VPVYTGRVLRVDLSTGHTAEMALTENDIRTYFLGSGMAARLFCDEVDPARDALDPRSPLYVFAGLLTGSILPTACRSTWCGRSPLTGIWGESNVGGYWGAELRFAGLDGLIVTGRAAEPVYLWIDGRSGTAAVRPAARTWGVDYVQAEEALRRETDPQARVAGIGPAGEHGVRFAAVMAGEGLHVRAAGRTGMGALMGSKQLKAIVVRGERRPAYPDAAGLAAAVRAANRRIRDMTRSMSEYGTAGGIVGAEKAGGLPLRNWQDGSWPAGAQAISGQRLRTEFFVEHSRCFGCPIGCGKVVQAEWEGAHIVAHGPEYETLCGFGGMLLDDNLPGLIAVNERCNRYGLDTISTSAVIAFATEAFQRGLLGPVDTGGLVLRWGDTATTLQLVDRIAHREGFGDRLAEGTRALARELGPEAEAFAAQVKGLEIAFHDPRAYTAMAAVFATANRGGCHMEGPCYWNHWGLAMPELGFPEKVDPADAVGQAGLAVAYQDYVSVYNPLGLCKFIIKAELGPAALAHWLRLAVGWEIAPEELLRTGERLYNLKRLLSMRLGVTRADDTLPARLLVEPRPTGEAAGRLPELATMLVEYDRRRGWEHGRPTAARLEELGISDLGLKPNPQSKIANRDR
jgi:aldehyde:ferredoxin oxidoreductase